MVVGSSNAVSFLDILALLSWAGIQSYLYSLSFVTLSLLFLSFIGGVTQITGDSVLYFGP
jgi:hypothetical protein